MRQSGAHGGDGSSLFWAIDDECRSGWDGWMGG